MVVVIRMVMAMVMVMMTVDDGEYDGKFGS